MLESLNDDRSNAAARIKSVALRLFAVRGVDGVSVREIANAAGQKNHAALTYHFGSKEALVRELIVDGARAIDERRNNWLDSIEAAGGPQSVLDVFLGLVLTSVTSPPPEGGECYNRFVLSVQMADRALFMDALQGKWNSGYQRCLTHIRRLLPAMCPAALNQRLIFMGAALTGIIAAREAELANLNRSHQMWSKDETLSEIAKALTRMVAGERE